MRPAPSRTLRVAALVTLFAACSPSDKHDGCLTHDAAFRVEISASGGHIPEKATLVVEYQGNERETYIVGTPTKNEDVCCHVTSPVSGALPSVSCVVPPRADSGTARSPIGGDASLDAGAPGSGMPRDSGVTDARAPGDASVAVADASAPAPDATLPPPSPREETVLLCELWTNGPAKIHLTARGYPALDMDLESKLRGDGCGVRTVEKRLTLTSLDAGG